VRAQESHIGRALGRVWEEGTRPRATRRRAVCKYLSRGIFSTSLGICKEWVWLTPGGRQLTSESLGLGVWMTVPEVSECERVKPWRG